MADEKMYQQVQEVLDRLRPFLLRDGGDCELVDIEDGIVRLRLLGACGTCPSSTITLKAGIERALIEEVPGVVRSGTSILIIRKKKRKENKGLSKKSDENDFGQPFFSIF